VRYGDRLGVSSRVFGFAARIAGVPAGESSSCGITSRSESFARQGIARIGSTIPLCRWPLPRLCGFPLPDLGDRRLNRSAESSRRVRLPLEFCPANPSQLAATSRLLSWTLVPFSTLGFGSPLAAGVPHPATFRLQGLATLLTAYSFRARAGFVSPRQRSWDSPFGAFPSRQGIRGVSARKDPPAVFPPVPSASKR
jgi:hypothetical protein